MARNNEPRTQNDPPKASALPMALLVAGAILVAALVGWALTRTVEPAAPEATVTGDPSATTTAAGATPAPETPAASTSAPQVPPTPNEVRRIGPEELKALVDRGGVTIVDVRDSVAYTAGHIPGSIHIPFARIEGESKYLPKDKPIVAYCT
jgi:hypothetical protein